MAKSTTKDSKKASAPLSTKNAGVTKASKTPKAQSKEVAKAAAKKIVKEKESKKSKKVESSSESESESESEDSESESEASSSDSESEEEKPVKKAATNGKKAAPAKKEESSDEDSDDSDSDSEEEAKPAAKAEESSDDSDSDEESEEEKPAAKETKKAAKAEESSDDSDDDDEEDSDDSDDSSEEEEEEKEAAPSKKRKAEEDIDEAPKKAKADAEDTPTTLFAGSLSWGVDDNILYEAFKQFDGLVGARVVTDKMTGKSRGFGYVDFSNAEAANKAHEAMQGAEIEGRAINLDHASSSRADSTPQSRANDRAKKHGDTVSPESDTLFVGNLPFEIDQESVREFFADIAEPTSVRLPTDQNTGDFKGFAYVSFSSVEEAKSAFEAKNGGSIGVARAARSVRLDFASARPPREGGGGFGGRGGGGFGGRGGGGFGGRGGGRGRGGFGGRGGGDRGGGRGRGGFGGRGGGSRGGYSGTKISFD